MYNNNRRALLGALWMIAALTAAQAQPLLKAEPAMRAMNSAEILQALRKLQVLGSVLYVAAHPDDENTRLIAYFTQGKGYTTSYLSLTRGDGGQNLIGNEKGPLLGLLRTQELLAARNIDGGQQRFSRAIDFGYSKKYEESLAIWNRDTVLGDVVRVIRELQPDVVITRFPGMEDGGGGHGHHTASFYLARDAFDLAADVSYPSDLPPWHAKRLLWNSWIPNPNNPQIDLSKYLKVNIGEYNSILGKSYSEIAAEARSQHRCQAFGSLRARGERYEYLMHKAGEPAKTELFEGINTSWTRLRGGDAVGKLLAKAEAGFDPRKPETILPLLLQAYGILNGPTVEEGHWKRQKTEELKRLILQCAGVYAEALSLAPTLASGDSLRAVAHVVKRSDFPLRWQALSLSLPGMAPVKLDKSLDNNIVVSQRIRFVAPPLRPGQPHWLTEAPAAGVYRSKDPDTWIGMPQNPPICTANFEFVLGTGKTQQTLTLDLPIVHKYEDPSVGELYQPYVATPRVTVDIAEGVYVLSDDSPKPISLNVRSHSDSPLRGDLLIEVPEGWRVSPAEIPIAYNKAGEEEQLQVLVTPSDAPGSGKLRILLRLDGETPVPAYSLLSIEYPHIPTQLLFPPAETRLVHFDLQRKGKQIAYIMGSGDEIPACLRQAGYDVTLLKDEEISYENLKKYDAVVAGIRAYNTRQRMPFIQDQVMKYVEDGGVYIVQYNTTFDLVCPVGPYPLKLSRDRVTVEEAPVSLLDAQHPLLASPNAIGPADFEGWVQERGLYFAGEWDSRYTALLSCNDPGESAKQGALLEAPYGKGYIIFTAFSWFRQLPEGVPGAYRLFANMIARGK